MRGRRHNDLRRYSAPLLAAAGTGVTAIGVSLAAAWLAGADISHWGRTGTWRMRWGRALVLPLLVILVLAGPAIAGGGHRLIDCNVCDGAGRVSA